MTGRTIIAVAAPFIAVYLLGAFIAWDFNAGHWGDLGRWIAAGAGAWSAGMCFAVERGAL